MTLKTK